MAWTVANRELTFRFTDARGDSRNRVVEIGAGNLLTDDDAGDMNGVSKSVVLSYIEGIRQVDINLTPDSDSEVKDACRLAFLLDDNTRAHFDIVDPKDELFLTLVGAGANIVIAYDDLDILDPPQLALKDIIDRVLSGDMLISDGETPVAYIEGFRL